MAKVMNLESQIDAYRGQAVSLSMKYTEATNVLGQTLNAQRFALNKNLEPGPNVDVSVIDQPEAPLGKVIIKP